MDFKKVFAVAALLGLAVAGFSQQEDVELRPAGGKVFTKGQTHYFVFDLRGLEGNDELVDRIKSYARTRANALATARGIPVQAVGNDSARAIAAGALGIEDPPLAGLKAPNPYRIVPISMVMGDSETVTSAGIDLKKIFGSGAERRNSMFLTATAYVMGMDGVTIPFSGFTPDEVSKTKVTGKDYSLGVLIPREILKFLRIPQEISGEIREEQRHGALPKMLTDAINTLLKRIIDQIAP